MTSTSQMAVFQLRNVTAASVKIPINRPAWKKAYGIPRNPVPITRFTMKKNPRAMLTVFGGWSGFLSLLHDSRSTMPVHIKRGQTCDSMAKPA